ncbi:MAG: hypothetical protein KKB20_10070 [Proteobacteria bacterium]|nr:hypothetical protein [Pseudomonadota bacterium]
MLEISLLMNSSIEDVIAFKCCALPDQNLEVHLRNTGDAPMVIPGYFILKNDDATRKVDNLYPPGGLTVPPGEVMAFYCHMDPDEWSLFKTISFFDQSGREYSSPI